MESLKNLDPNRLWNVRLVDSSKYRAHAGVGAGGAGSACGDGGAGGASSAGDAK